MDELTDIASATKQLLPHLPQRVQNRLGPLTLLALQPGYAMVRTLFLAPLCKVKITQPHAYNVPRCRVDALERVLVGGRVPVGQRARCVGFSKGLVPSTGEEDIEDDLAHALVLECFKVNLVDARDLGDQRREHDEDHVEGSYQGCQE